MLGQSRREFPQASASGLLGTVVGFAADEDVGSDSPHDNRRIEVIHSEIRIVRV